MDSLLEGVNCKQLSITTDPEPPSPLLTTPGAEKCADEAGEEIQADCLPLSIDERLFTTNLAIQSFTDGRESPPTGGLRPRTSA